MALKALVLKASGSRWSGHLIGPKAEGPDDSGPCANRAGHATCSRERERPRSFGQPKGFRASFATHRGGHHSSTASTKCLGHMASATGGKLSTLTGAASHGKKGGEGKCERAAAQAPQPAQTKCAEGPLRCSKCAPRHSESDTILPKTIEGHGQLRERTVLRQSVQLQGPLLTWTSGLLPSAGSMAWGWKRRKIITMRHSWWSARAHLGNSAPTGINAGGDPELQAQARSFQRQVETTTSLPFEDDVLQHPCGETSQDGDQALPAGYSAN